MFFQKNCAVSRRICKTVIAEKYAIFRIYVARELAFCLEI